MNEENKTQDDGYQEIDISKPQKEEPEKDYEVEEEETEQPKVETKKEDWKEAIKDAEEENDKRFYCTKSEYEKALVIFNENAHLMEVFNKCKNEVVSSEKLTSFLLNKRNYLILFNSFSNICCR